MANASNNPESRPRPSIRNLTRPNQRVLFLLLFLLIAAAGGLLVRARLAAKQSATATPGLVLPGGQNPGTTPGNKVDVLPQLERPADSDMAGDSLDPFLGPLQLIGVVTGGEGSNVAIIRSQSATHVVTVGDTVLDYWLVVEIGKDQVSLHSASRDLVLEFSGAAG